MKLVAKNDFFNAKPLGITLDPKHPNFRHENHVHKGVRFSIGTAETYGDLSLEQKEFVGSLLKSNCIVFDNKENAENGVIKKIDAEAAQDAKDLKAAQAPQTSLEERIAGAVVQALLDAGIIAPAKKT